MINETSENLIKKLQSENEALQRQLELKNDRIKHLEKELLGIDIPERRRLELALRESEEKYRAIIENTSESIIVAQDNVLKFMNRKACELFEIEQAERFNIPLTDFIYPDDQELVFDRYKRRLNREALLPKKYAFRIVSKEKNLKWVEISASAFSWEGKPAVLSFLSEITEQIAKDKRRSEELLLLKTLINHLPSSIFVLDNRYRKTVFNEAHLKRVEGTLNWQRPLKEEDLLGKTNWDIYPKELADQYFIEDRKVIEEGLTIIERENYQIDQNGNPVWETISKIPMRDSDGLIIGMVGIAHDITERKLMLNKLKASEEKFRLISNSAHDGIFLLNEDNKFIYWNPAVERIFEYLGEELVYLNINKLLVSPNQRFQNYLPINVSRRAKVLDDKGVSFELEVERRDGSIIQIELSLAPMKVSTHWGAVGIVRDITERKTFEHELIHAKERAEESDRLKSAFLATMSHELRTPLNAVIGFSSLIEETMEKSEIIEMVKIINDSGNHLLNIIDSVFSLSLLQSGVSKLVPEDINLLNFMTGLKPYLKTKLAKEKKDKDIKVVLSKCPIAEQIVIRSDKTKLTQLMVNFFDNAIKYSKVGTIEYGAIVEAPSITFYVKDTGIGIPTDKQTIIFERFRQVEDSLTRVNGGVGLGLSICEEIADLMEGKIWLESELGIGSTFYFKLDHIIIQP